MRKSPPERASWWDVVGWLGGTRFDRIDHYRVWIHNFYVDKLINETLFTSLAQTRVATALWRVVYNTARPHSQIAWQTPDAFASTFTPRRSLALRHATGAAQAPAAASAQQGMRSRETLAVE